MRTIRVCPLCETPKVNLKGEMVCPNGRCSEYGGVASRKHRQQLREKKAEGSRIITPDQNILVPTGIRVKK